jgi:hypothetical protein
MKRLALLLAFVSLPAAAQQDCAVGAHQFKDGACTMTMVNTCGRPLNCTLLVEGVTARGDRISDSRGVAIPAGGSQSISVMGVARCGTFDAQCSPAGGQQRRR